MTKKHRPSAPTPVEEEGFPCRSKLSKFMTIHFISNLQTNITLSVMNLCTNDQQIEAKYKIYVTKSSIWLFFLGGLEQASILPALSLQSPVEASPGLGHTPSVQSAGLEVLPHFSFLHTHVDLQLQASGLHGHWPGAPHAVLQASAIASIFSFPSPLGLDICLPQSSELITISSCSSSVISDHRRQQPHSLESTAQSWHPTSDFSSSVSQSFNHILWWVCLLIHCLFLNGHLYWSGHVWRGVPVDSMSDPKWTPLLQWSCVVGCESRIGHQKCITCWM